MDVDAFVAVHAPEWARTEELLRRGRLTGAEADELVRAYQRTATNLSQLRSEAPEPALIARLSAICAQARAKIAGTHDPGLSDVARFFRVVLPIALYRVRWWSITVTAACLLVALLSGWWVTHDADALAALGTPNDLQEYVNNAFAAYYSENPAPSFMAQVWTNNAWIAARCIGSGITGILPLTILFQNSVAIGNAGGIMTHYGASEVFFGLILPHGLLELSAVFVAGAAGLRLFWVLVSPGSLPRSKALAQEGRAVFTIVIGLTIALAISGVIEAFVTPSSLPTGVKIAIGAVACAGFWVYSIVPGRRALRDGHSADLRADQAEADVAYAA